MTVQLKQLDLSLSKKHEHPDIKTDETEYLCKIDGDFFAGRFSRQWYGLNFDGWINPAGLQFDAPGQNASMWQEIYEIKPEDL